MLNNAIFYLLIVLAPLGELFYAPYNQKWGSTALGTSNKGSSAWHVTGEGVLANSQTTSPPLLGDSTKCMTWQLVNAFPSRHHCLLAQKRRLTMCPVDNATQRQQNRPGAAVLGDVSLYGVKGWCCSFTAQWWEVETRELQSVCFYLWVYFCLWPNVVQGYCPRTPDLRQR